MMAQWNQARRKSSASTTLSRQDSGIAGLDVLPEIIPLERQRTLESIHELPVTTSPDNPTSPILSSVTEHSSDAAASKRPCLLFRLPAELRIQIYELVWASAPTNTTLDILATKPTSPSPALLLTSWKLHHDARSVYAEAYNRYWSTNTFRLTVDYASALARMPRGRWMQEPLRACSREFVAAVEAAACPGWESLRHLEAVQLRPQARVVTRKRTACGLWERETDVWVSSAAAERSVSRIRLRCHGVAFEDLALQMVDARADGNGDGGVGRPWPSVKHQLMFLAGW
ncbi:hypothetical protein LTR62_006424 [Meristemomyces frigidus]|uniref:F-box domain-containing protein n=1 Tax=Meristemomyces frigidus TaxID=1508187 RepID=A0AAN7YEJ3_9PEZI|nr:hypothetical protein LTR62_006424 [Meristemomyces frigidus]